jgi:hypothetical protein
MDKQKIRNLAERFQMSEFNIEEQPYYTYDYRQGYNDYSYRYDSVYDRYETQRRQVVSLKMPIEQLEKITDLADEFDRLLHDGETRELIYQARFIHKLRYGRI